MSNISVIIPVHEFNETVAGYLKKAVTSIEGQQGVEDLPPVVIVYSPLAEAGGVLDFIQKENEANTPLKYTTIKNEGKTDFCSQINLGAKNVTTDYFAILEYDDMFSLPFFKVVAKHIKAMPDVGVFLPFTIDVDDKSQTLVQIVNQIIWSKGIVGENGTLGFLNQKSMNESSYYALGGSVIKKSEFIAVGGLKSNIKLAFTYEFILRFLDNGNKIYSMAHFGYRHIINRVGSLFSNYNATMSMKERRFWFETAKKESHFFNDRVVDISSLTEQPTIQPKMTVA